MTDAPQPTRLRPRAARAGRLIAVASGKGGVGKTWLAITLGHALARAGRRVLLFDADLGLANVDVQLGLTPERDLGAVVAGRLALDGACCATPRRFDILPGRSGSGALAALDAAALERRAARAAQAARRLRQTSCSTSAPAWSPRCAAWPPSPTCCW